MADADDVSPPIVDCDVLEAAKENIQPLASGRRVTALSAILSTPHAERESRLADARKRHRANVEIALEDDSDDADPLECYCRFVYWTVESYPQGYSAVLELLEEATRKLRDDRGGKWRRDIRYLKLWVLYANYVDKPTVIYKFLLVNEIGTSHALFYEEYALALERANRRVEADDTYLLGIARKAAPLERLEAKHREFQKRMMASPTIPSSTSSDSATENEPPHATNAASRRVLGEPPAASSSRSRSSRTASTRAPSVSEDVFSAPAPARPNARMPVFVDAAGDAENDPSQATNPTPWPELGTRKTRVKENLVEVSKAAGTKIRHAGRSTRAGSSSTIAVFRDPGPEAAGSAEMPPPPVPPAKKEKTKPVAVPSTPKFVPFVDEEPSTPSSSTHPLPPTNSVMKPKPAVKDVVMSAEAEALRKDPFKNYDEEERPLDD